MKFSLSLFVSSLLIGKIQSLVSNAPYLRNESRPLILAHRGDMGSFPEHTFAAYSSAYISGVDFVEIDL